MAAGLYRVRRRGRGKTLKEEEEEEQQEEERRAWLGSKTFFSRKILRESGEDRKEGRGSSRPSVRP